MDEKKVREAIYCMKSFADDTEVELIPAELILHAKGWSEE